MFLKTFLSAYIFDFLRFIIVDDVTRVFDIIIILICPLSTSLTYITIYHHHLLMGFLSLSTFVMQEHALNTTNFLNEESYKETSGNKNVKNLNYDLLCASSMFDTTNLSAITMFH